MGKKNVDAACVQGAEQVGWDVLLGTTGVIFFVPEVLQCKGNSSRGKAEAIGLEELYLGRRNGVVVNVCLNAMPSFWMMLLMVVMAVGILRSFRSLHLWVSECVSFPFP